MNNISPIQFVEQMDGPHGNSHHVAQLGKQNISQEKKKYTVLFTFSHISWYHHGMAMVCQKPHSYYFLENPQIQKHKTKTDPSPLSWSLFVYELTIMYVIPLSLYLCPFHHLSLHQKLSLSPSTTIMKKASKPNPSLTRLFNFLLSL